MQKKPSISTDGAYDFVDVRDVQKAYPGASLGRSGEAYLLSGSQVTVSEYRQMVQEAAGIRSHEIRLPDGL
jgi:nucleoside-diphosphate-sugar epimerase